jgi:hypothetical protein
VPHEEEDSLLYASHVPVAPPWQQPLGQVWASQEQVPLVVSQTPFVQLAQSAPPAPHFVADSEAYATHVPPAEAVQHPPGQEVASQTQVPLVLLHSWPALHVPQVAPPAPHWLLVSLPYGTQVLPLQQPFGHECASQTHAPLVVLHSWPVAQLEHAEPAAPHMLLVSLPSGSQLTPLQQPEHTVPSHVHAPLVEQVCPEPHAPHAAPPAPHSPASCEVNGTHAVPLQQPFGHDVPSQTHVPLVLLHSWPEAQAAHVAPPAPHEGVDSEPYSSHVPDEPPLQQPFGQVVASHLQLPLVVSQSPFAQLAHEAPPWPHSEADSDESATHVPPLQHPLGHEVASQTQTPAALHSWPVAQALQVAPPAPHEVFDSLAYATQLVPLQQPFGHDVALHTHWPLVVLQACPAAQAPHAWPPVPQEPVDSLP